MHRLHCLNVTLKSMMAFSHDFHLTIQINKYTQRYFSENRNSGNPHRTNGYKNNTHDMLTSTTCCSRGYRIESLSFSCTGCGQIRFLSKISVLEIIRGASIKSSKTVRFMTKPLFAREDSRPRYDAA